MKETTEKNICYIIFSYLLLDMNIDWNDFVFTAKKFPKRKRFRHNLFQSQTRIRVNDKWRESWELYYLLECNVLSPTVRNWVMCGVKFFQFPSVFRKIFNTQQLTRKIEYFEEMLFSKSLKSSDWNFLQLSRKFLVPIQSFQSSGKPNGTEKEFSVQILARWIRAFRYYSF